MLRFVTTVFVQTVIAFYKCPLPSLQNCSDRYETRDREGRNLLLNHSLHLIIHTTDPPRYPAMQKQVSRLLLLH